MSDLIDRQSAIDAIHEDADWLAEQGSDWQVERMERDKSILKSLPSAQPDNNMPTQSNTLNALGKNDCISRQAVLDYIGNMSSELTEDGRRMIRRIRLTEYIQNSLPSTQPEQRWIPVGEGKPKDGTVCLITYSNGFVKIATFAEDLYEFDEYDFHNKRGVAGWYYLDDEWGMYFAVDNVVAWMPLPEPYKEEA